MDFETVNKDLALQNWIRLIDFGQKALDMNRDVGQVIRETLISKNADGSDPVETSIKRLNHMSDFTFFTLGPVYVNCAIPNDLFGQFRDFTEISGARYNGPHVVLGFNTPLASGLHDYDYIIEGMHRGAAFDSLVAFMLSQGFYKAPDNYWRVKATELLIPDPCAIDLREYDSTKVSDYATITVFAPSGNKYSVVPEITNMLSPPVLGFKRRMADPLVVNEASAYLKIKQQG
jgi:hypothetical protein